MLQTSRLVSAGGALLLLAAVLAGCGRREADSKNAPPVPQVLVNAADVVRAEARRLESGISFTGELVPGEIVDVVARFDGDLEAVLVREGQAVRRGQPLARFKPRDVKDAWQAADADLQAAHANLATAEAAERRAKRLLEAGAASPSELEAAQTQRSAAAARVRAAEAQVNIAAENTEKLDVPSPITGSVSQLFVHSGARLAIADKLLTVVDTRILELSATIPSEVLSSVQRGTPIQFRLDAYPGETFSGQVDRVNPTTEPGTRQVRVYTRLQNTDGRLVGGLFASGRIINAVKDNATAAPLSALRQEGTEQVVYRLKNGAAQRVPVRTGVMDEAAGVIEIAGAVSPGDSLLTGVLPGLRDGARVQILGGGGAAPPTAQSSSVRSPGGAADYAREGR